MSHARFAHLGWILIVLALGAYGLLLAQNMGVYAGGSDSSGYLNHARLLASGHLHTPGRVLPELNRGPIPFSVYAPLGFKVASDGHSFVPTYPAGLSLMIMAVAPLVGWAQAGNVILWLHGIAGALVAYAAARAFGLSRRASVIGTVMIAGSPLYLLMSLQAMSDVPALVWTTAAIAAAWTSRSKTAWAFGAGALYAMAVLVRPTDALALVPIAIALGFSWRRWLAFGLGGIPGAIFFCLHSHAAYGKYFTTGYGDSAGLEKEWIVLTLKHYARWLPVILTPVVVAFLGLPWIFRQKRREVALLVAWFAIFAGFYAMYSCTHETWWYLRFLLPAAPALALGALLVLQTLTEERLSGRRATIAAVATMLCVGGSQLFWVTWLKPLNAGTGERVYLETTSWAREHLPANAAVAVMQQSGAFTYYTDFAILRYDELHGTDFARIAAALSTSGRPLYAVLVPFEVSQEHALTEHMPVGSWDKVGTVRDVTIWKWSPSPRPVN